MGRRDDEDYADRPLRRRDYDDDDDDDDDRGGRRRKRRGFRCPFCDSDIPPKSKSKVSTAGWIVLVFLIVVFPLNLFALFIRDEYRVCRECGMKLE